MSVNSQQLEDEADALVKALNEPPKAPEDTAPEDTAAATDEIKAEAEVPAAKPESDPDASPAHADTDELEGLSLENAAERIRNAQARMTRATTEAAQLRRALSEFETDSQRLEDEVRRLQAALPDPTKPPATDTANGMATLETLRDDYPQIIGPLIGTLQELRSEIDGLKGTVTTREENLARRDDDDKRNRAKAAQEAHISVIRAAHPDFQQVVNSEDFQGWADRQSRTTKIILFGDGIQGSPLRTGGTAAEVNDVLTQYKQAVGSSNRTDAARDAASPTLRKTTRVQSNGRTTFTRDQIAAMSPAEFSKNEAAIDAAMAEGRVT